MATKNTKTPVVDETVKVTLRDVEFTVYRDPMDWEHDAMDHLNSGKVSRSLEAILGPQQYAKFTALRPKMREAVELLNTIAENVGAGDSGN